MTMRRTFSGLSGNPHADGWNPLTLALLAGVWIAALPNWPLWQALLALPETHTARGGLFVAGFGVMVAALTALLLTLLAWRATIKPAIALLLLAAAFGAHFMGSYGVVIDTTMMTNVLQTDPREVRDLLSLRMLGTVLLLAGLPLLALWRVPVRGLGFWRQAGRNLLGLVAFALVLAALLFALFADLSATMRNHRTMRYLINPVNSLYALVDLGFASGRVPSGPPLAIGADAHILPRPAGTKPTLLVLVVGETARADHFALDGYARPTNPALAALGVASFRNVMSCGTNTATSLPCMFSALGKKGFESRARDQQNLLDLVQRAGMAVLWVDNQAGCKGLCERVPNAYAHDPVAGVAALPAALCDGEDCLDEALLHGLDARLAALPAAARARGVLIVLHQMGSHGPAYFKRSPPDRKPFLPECTSNALQQCDHQALVNAYDNSIAYTDHVLGQTIQWLQQQASRYDPALLYLSDHGESLGENNLYLHGLPYAVAPVEQKHVPMVLWLAAPAAAQSACIAGLRDAALTHDNLFHSVLGLLGIRAAEYRPTLDAFAACRAP
ncbi:MAG TPA: phosphoethanolamine--lipid A transferase [Burkholderiaceae bacterium]|nr:phosphoethanolamine--lipid A transferase [Burkholderiaceae bacterium]